MGFWRWFSDEHFAIVLGTFVLLCFIGAILFIAYGIPAIFNFIETHIPKFVIGIILFTALGICIFLLCLSFWCEYKDYKKESKTKELK